MRRVSGHEVGKRVIKKQLELIEMCSSIVTTTPLSMRYLERLRAMSLLYRIEEPVLIIRLVSRMFLNDAFNIRYPLIDGRGCSV